MSDGLGSEFSIWFVETIILMGCERIRQVADNGFWFCDCVRDLQVQPARHRSIRFDMQGEGHLPSLGAAILEVQNQLRPTRPYINRSFDEGPEEFSIGFGASQRRNGKAYVNMSWNILAVLEPNASMRKVS